MSARVHPDTRTVAPSLARTQQSRHFTALKRRLVKSFTKSNPLVGIPTFGAVDDQQA
jgi:hypothetical protein